MGIWTAYDSFLLFKEGHKRDADLALLDNDNLYFGTQSISKRPLTGRASPHRYISKPSPRPYAVYESSEEWEAAFKSAPIDFDLILSRTSDDHSPLTSQSSSPEPYTVSPDSSDEPELPREPISHSLPTSTKQVSLESEADDARKRKAPHSPPWGLASWFESTVKRRTGSFISSLKRNSSGTLLGLISPGDSFKSLSRGGNVAQAISFDGVSADELRYALLCDEGIRSIWMRALLEPRHNYDVTSVQRVMDTVQLEIDSTSDSDIISWASPFEIDLSQGFSSGSSALTLPELYRKRCLQFLRQLSRTYQVLPSSLVLQQIKRVGNSPVGGGGFADIWHGTIGDQSVCLKVLRLVVEPDDEVRNRIRRQFCNEALLWRQLKHPNILPLLGVNEKLFSPSFCLVSPWMANKDIMTYLRQHPMYNRPGVLLEIAAGLAYLHSRTPPIVHGDIRGANILVTDDFHCCLADFGLALVTADSRSWSTATTTGMKGAIRWMAPELVVQSSADQEVVPHHTSRDIYAFGCTVVEILTLQVPFHHKRTDAAVIYSLLLGERPDRPENVWCPDSIWDLTTRCWAQNAATRPPASEVYETISSSESLRLSSLTFDSSGD